MGRVYASALDPAKTTDSLQALETYMDLAGSQIFTFHRESGTILDSQMCAAIHNALSDDYLNHWGNVDPRVPALGTLPSGDVLLCHEWFDDRFVGRDGYYQEFLIPSGFRWAIGGVFDAGEGATTVVAGLRAPDQPAFDKGSARLLGRMLPHIQRAALLRTQVQRSAAANGSPSGMVEAIPLPCFITDDRGRMALSNQAFADALPTLPLQLAGSWLRFADADLHGRWRACLGAVSASRAARSFQAPGPGGSTLRFHVVPWHALATNTCDAADQRLMLVMIETPSRSGDQTRMQRLCADAGLTEAESRILSLVAKGYSAKAIARLRNASAYTVRNQIARILGKTQCHSQRELLARLGN